MKYQVMRSRSKNVFAWPEIDVIAEFDRYEDALDELETQMRELGYTNGWQMKAIKESRNYEGFDQDLHAVGAWYGSYLIKFTIAVKR